MVIPQRDSVVFSHTLSPAQLGPGISSNLEEARAPLDVQRTKSKDYKNPCSSTLVSLHTASAKVLPAATAISSSSSSHCAAKVLCSFGDDCQPTTVEVESAPPKVPVGVL